MGAWKRVPPGLLFGLAIEAVFGIARVFHYLDDGAYRNEDGWNVYEQAFTFASSGLVASGLFELARRLPRPFSIGALVASIGVLGWLVWALGWMVIDFYGGSHEFEPVRVIVPILEWVPPLTLLMTAAGFAFATRKLAWMIALPLAILVLFPVPPLAEPIAKLFHADSRFAFVVLRIAPYPALAVAYMFAARTASASADPSPGERGDRAFDRAANALWLRVIAAVSLAGITLLVFGAEARDGVSLMRAVVVLAPLVDAIALIAFARGALGVARANVARWFVLPAAAAALWSAGVLCLRASYTATLLYGHWRDYSHYEHDEDPMSRADLLPVLLPLVMCAAIVLVLVAITQLFRERNREDLRENAAVRTGVVVALMLGSLYITHHEADADVISKSRFVLGLVAAAFASIYALVIAAKLCKQAATVVADDAALPNAKLVSERPR